MPTLDVGCHLVLVEKWSAGELMRVLALGERRIRDEFARQVRKILAAGIQPSHLDTHKHSHLLPAVLRAVASVGREFGIDWVRRSFGPLPVRAPRDVKTTDYFAGFGLTGKLDTPGLVAALDKLPAGLTELMCHPGRLGPELQVAPTRLKESRAVELAALTSGEARATIARRGIALVNYRLA